jgi:nitrile hydratase
MRLSKGFKVNERVLVKRGPPEPHCRTPFYLRGKIGTVEEEVGRFPNPSLLAYYKPGLPKLRLFRVRFDQQNLWPEYGPSTDSLYADLYENWLSPFDDDGSSNVTKGESHA